MENSYRKLFHILAGNQIDFDYGDEALLASHGVVTHNEDGSPVPLETLTEDQLDYVNTQNVIRSRMIELVEMSRELAYQEVREVIRRFYDDPNIIEMSISVAFSFDDQTIDYTLKLRHKNGEAINQGIAHPLKLLLMRHGYNFNNVQFIDNTTEGLNKFFYRDDAQEVWRKASQYEINDKTLKEMGVRLRIESNDQGVDGYTYDDTGEYGDWDDDYQGDEEDWY